MKRNNIEISRELRLKTLNMILQGKEVHEMAMEFKISAKTIKYRLTLIYGYYRVKNRVQLMALYVNIPIEVRKYLTEEKVPIIRKTTYKTKEQFGPLPIGNENDIQLPNKLDTKK
jgi:DNA-binding CsgD family transcriptional regulator